MTGDDLRALREELNVTEAELAMELGWPLPMLSDCERVRNLITEREGEAYVEALAAVVRKRRAAKGGET